MARCPAHGNRIQLNASRAVNLFGATPQPDCRRTYGDIALQPVIKSIAFVDKLSLMDVNNDTSGFI
jgi:hypothetical protein